MPMNLTPKRVRILRALLSAPDWMTRKQMEPVAGKKDFSEALGSPATGVRPDSLEARGLVARQSDVTPYEYKITAEGRTALHEVGYAVSARVPRRGQRSDATPTKLIAADALQTDFDEALRKSLRDSPEKRRRRLANASKVPVAVWSVVYRRNSDVVAEALYQAQGTCRLCGANAPFSRGSDGTPYLEVHHRKTLAEGGEDTIENAIAVCPNCHRKAHYA